jgi:hypothetical protein
LLGFNKALWISSTLELSNDASKELEAVKSQMKLKRFDEEWRDKQLNCTSAETKDKEIGTVLFAAYSTMRSGRRHSTAWSNLFAVSRWLGAAYDGLVSILRICFFAINKTNSK